MRTERIYLSLIATVFFISIGTFTVAQETSTGSKHSTVTGCLSGPNSEGAFVLKTAKGHGFEVGGNDQLKSHVGHTVKLTGTWVKSGTEIGEKESTDKVEEHENAEHQGVTERHFKVTDVQHVSDSCSQSGTTK